MKSVSDIRNDFLEFFREREHEVVRSAPVVPNDDPTLLFTNAGMNQFKDVFLGTGERSYSRAADTQKCIRAGGKHNDLDAVGYDTYHHTFFEMLGNWSFGDYYKRDAIQWAWTLLTEVWGLDKSRLYATVFAGDEDDGLPVDEEAETLWREVTDIDPSHILRFGKKENFWEMGETGPCGPCSEIHYDFTPDKSGAELVNGDDERVIEIWNLVFMEFERQQGGKLVGLPAKHVDTGMGLERITAVLQGKTSNYDTDIFQPLIQAVAELTDTPYEDGFEGRRHRAIADHLRALSFSIADGGRIENRGRGYVLKRILRRASRFLGELGMEEPCLFKLVPKLIEQMGDVFPELGEHRDRIQKAIKDEEESFLHTLAMGLKKFQEIEDSLRAAGSTTVSGADAWDLHQTYGFLIDLTEQMARERELTVDLEGFEKERNAQAAQGRATQTFNKINLSGLGEFGPTEFHGHNTDRIKNVEVVKATDNELVLDRTPFYPEGGGPKGDKGIIYAPDGFEFQVEDTQRIGDLIVHHGSFLRGGPQSVSRMAVAEVDRGTRSAIKRNHTATHILHWALRYTLGDEVTQQGSVIKPESFTFDFAYPRALTDGQVAEIERLVNERIMANDEVDHEEMSYSDAMKKGAVALFGEKYGEKVRVCSIGDGYSTELCGGIHVERTGDIGSMSLVKESNVAANVRRVELVAGGFAVEQAIEAHQILTRLSHAFKVPTSDLITKIEDLAKQNKELRKEASKARLASVSPKEILGEADQVGETRLLVHKLADGNAEVLRKVGDAVKAQDDKMAAVLLGPGPKGVIVLAALSSSLVDAGWDARALLKAVTSILGGGGGGRPDLAQGRGKNADKIDEAVATAKAVMTEKAKA